MILYGFFYNPCTYESGEVLLSLHLSKVGAYRALRDYLWSQAVEGRNFHLQYGGTPNAYRVPHWTTHRIKECEVYP